MNAIYWISYQQILLAHDYWLQMYVEAPGKLLHPMLSLHAGYLHQLLASCALHSGALGQPSINGNVVTTCFPDLADMTKTCREWE